MHVTNSVHSVLNLMCIRNLNEEYLLVSSNTSTEHNHYIHSSHHTLSTHPKSAMIND